MSSNLNISRLDIAKRALKEQRRTIAHDITDLNRELRKIDAALGHLEPVSRNGKPSRVRNRPTAQEAMRRSNLLRDFYDHRLQLTEQFGNNSQSFDLDDLLDFTKEPQELRKVYQSLVNHTRHLFQNVPGKRGLYQIVMPGDKHR